MSPKLRLHPTKFLIEYGDLSVVLVRNREADAGTELGDRIFCVRERICLALDHLCRLAGEGLQQFKVARVHGPGFLVQKA